MMQQLSLSDATALVRKNLDEADPNGSVMYTDDDSDNSSLDDIIAKNLPEAINAINLTAPVTLIEGKVLKTAELETEVTDDLVLSFSLPKDSKFLRLVAFKAYDSDFIVTDILGEGTSEGRKQLNKWLRGQYDCPRLVLLNDGEQMSFRYYSMASHGKYFPIDYFEYVEELTYNKNTTGYDIASRLRQNIIDCLTAMVMEVYSDQRAQYFFQKASNFPRV